MKCANVADIKPGSRKWNICCKPEIKIVFSCEFFKKFATYCINCINSVKEYNTAFTAQHYTGVKYEFSQTTQINIAQKEKVQVADDDESSIKQTKMGFHRGV